MTKNMSKCKWKSCHHGLPPAGQEVEVLYMEYGPDTVFDSPLSQKKRWEIGFGRFEPTIGWNTNSGCARVHYGRKSGPLPELAIPGSEPS